MDDGIKLWRTVREASLVKVDERDSFDVSKGARSKEIMDGTLWKHKNLSRYLEQQNDLRHDADCM